MWRVQNDNDEVLAFRVRDRLAILALDRRPPSGGLACVCACILFLVGSGSMLTVALVDGWGRDLHDVPSPFDPSQLRHAAPVARIRLDRDRRCASEGGPIGWVADHRKHHAHSDEEDVRSPSRLCLGPYAWWMRAEDTEHTPEFYEKWGPDLNKDPVHRWFDSYQLVCPVVVRGALRLGGMSWLIWGGFVRSVFVRHSTWLVNSASHVWGYRSTRPATARRTFGGSPF